MAKKDEAAQKSFDDITAKYTHALSVCEECPFCGRCQNYPLNCELGKSLAKELFGER